jgi:periplasmic protein TonB
LSGFLIKKLNPLSIALLVSAILHIVLIASINFTFPDLRYEKDKISALDVVLVNAKTKSKPNKADALAQANLNRGGNTDENRQMKSALPPPKIKTSELTVAEQTQASTLAAQAATAQAEDERKQQRVSDLEKQAQEVMTQLNSMKKIETKPTQQASAVLPADGQNESSIKNPDAKDLMETSLEIARLEAQIAKQQEEYQKRPKRKSLGARTQEYRFATYVEAWRQKVERIGNLNYPEAAKEQQLYGQLRMTVSIKSDGSIEKIVINQSSGHRILDEGAKHIVEIAAPYPKFPENLSQDTDIIDITRTWTFTKEDGLATKSD